MFNLFDVTRSIEAPLSSKPRAANDSEILAYAQWLRQRRGLPDMGRTELHFTENRQGRRYERGHCIGATFGDYTSNANRREYEPGAYSIVMPGHDAARQRVTFEVLDDSGDVLSSQALPMEPKKGGVIWSRDDVRKAHGPVAKVAKARKRAPIAADAASVADECPEFCPPQAAGGDCAPDVTQGCGEAPDALHGADLPTVEPSSEAEQLPGDPLADLAARVAALEARIAALPAESEATPSGEVARPKRTPAHERAIRRAWAERKARRDADKLANQLMISEDRIYHREQEALRELSQLRDTLAVAQQSAGEAMRMAETIARRGNQHATRRRASASRARRLLASTRKAATFQRQRADVLAAQLDKLRSDMADPSQPERASDLARLVQERDQARTALAATDARNRAMKAALDDLAAKFEAMGSRLAVAEAAMRRAPIAV